MVILVYQQRISVFFVAIPVLANAVFSKSFTSQMVNP